MSIRYVIWSGLALLAFCLAGLGGWIISLPAAPTVAESPPITKNEMNAMLAALKPPKRQRPLVAIVGVNNATETTDYLLPTGILRQADVADVVMLAIEPGPVKLYPALTVEADATTADFDKRNPAGADYVIVPAMSRDDDPAVLAWLQAQAKSGAIIIGICAGAKVVGAAGLLDGKRATTHWYYVKEMLDRNPSINYVADRRMVTDHGTATTTGITASMPMMLTLIEAIGGRAKADAIAGDLGVPTWDARHASNAFKLTQPFATTVLSNMLAFWNREKIGLELRKGMNEVSLALVADAWSRTYRSKAVTFAASTDSIETRNGIRIIPDKPATGRLADEYLYTIADPRPVDALDQALLAITARYGERTAQIIAMQLEYPQ